MIRMREGSRAASVSLLLVLAVWPATGSAAVAAPVGCGPTPRVLENPPEMARVDSRIQSRTASGSASSIATTTIAPVLRQRFGYVPARPFACA